MCAGSGRKHSLRRRQDSTRVQGWAHSSAELWVRRQPSYAPDVPGLGPFPISSHVQVMVGRIWPPQPLIVSPPTCKTSSQSRKCCLFFFCPFMYSLCFCFLSLCLCLFLSLPLFVLPSLPISPHPLTLHSLAGNQKASCPLRSLTHLTKTTRTLAQFWPPLRQGRLLVGKSLIGPSSSSISSRKRP